METGGHQRLYASVRESDGSLGDSDRGVRLFGARAFQEVVKVTQGHKCGSLTQ